jgi:hypothetical protein
LQNQEGRPSFSVGVYELRDRFGAYRNVRPSIETSRGTTLVFQTPHIGGSLHHEVEEDLQIARLLTRFLYEPIL